MRRFTLLFILPVLAVLVLQVLPLITGASTLYLRDVMTSHLPLEAAQANLLRDGHVLPIADPYRSGGQPLLGNPNALPLYPTKGLYAVASTLRALNAHFWIHWLLAPFAGFWLGRAWGLGRPGAWAVGTTYAVSGTFLSQLNLYNLVAAAALTPALIAAALDAASRDPIDMRSAPWRRGWALVALLWALIVAGGDPMSAVLAAVLAISAIAARHGIHPERRRGLLLGLGSALALGTLVVSPMLVELARILPVSHRAAVPSDTAAILAQSVDPRSVIEWLVPLAFGDVGHGFWGTSFYGGNTPLFYSLAPGVLVLASIWAAGRPRSTAGRWAWTWVAVGGFVAMGWYNPLIRAAVETFGGLGLRYPVKVWTGVAIATALIAGLGFERALTDGGRRLVRALAVLAIAYGGVWWTLVRLPEPIADFLRSLDPLLAGPFFASEYARWLTTCTVLLATTVALLLGALLLRRRPTAAAVLLLVVHVGSQSSLLAPLIDMDRADVYQPAAELLAAVPADARVAHGAFGHLFGTLTADVSRAFPDLRFSWQTREDVASMGPGGGILVGRRFALNRSPERLDTYPSSLTAQIVAQLDDRQRLRMLEVDGVDRLIVPRPLDGVDPGQARLITRLQPSSEGPTRLYDLHVYALDRAVPPFRLVGRTEHRGDMRSAVEALTDPAHDPMTTALLPTSDDVSPLDGPPGTVQVLADELESVRLQVESPAGGVVVSRRAWLPVWRAEVDDTPVAVELVDLHKLGVRVPPGEHTVHLWIDRRPTRVACALAIVALLLLGAATIDRRGTTARSRQI